jgi:hypothetical protein
MKKIIILLMLVISSFAAFGYEPYILLSTHEDNGIKIDAITVIINNNYYRGFFEDGFVKEGGHFFRFFSDDGFLSESEADSSFQSLIEYAPGITRIEVWSDELLYSRDITFCNYNGICEPCFSDDCSTAENTLVCSDCSPSERDNFCNLLKDDICDPDCTLQYYGGPDSSDVCVEEDFYYSTCFEIGGSFCEPDEICRGFETYLQSAEDVCCVGMCESRNIIDYYDGLRIDSPQEKRSYLWILVVFGIILLIALAYIKVKKIIIIPLIIVLIPTIFLLGLGISTFNTDTKEQITGYAVQPGVISSYPSFFSYGTQRNMNLIEALSLITAEFNKKGIELTPELLASMIATLRMEVGNSFKPISEYSFRFCPRYNGGCDYRGRGYIQLTHRSNYEKDCGPECILEAGQSCRCASASGGCHENDIIRDGKLGDYIKECPPARALLPSYAAKAFVSYYERRNLVKLSNEQDFWKVGKYINGGNDYADEFEVIARQQLSIIRQFPGIIDFLKNQQPSPEPPATPVLPKEVISGQTFGYYYLNPSFRAEAAFDLSKIDETASDAKVLVLRVRGCSDTLRNCVSKHVKNNWAFSCSETERICTFDVDTGDKDYIYDSVKKVYEKKPYIIRFALYFASEPDNRI